MRFDHGYALLIGVGRTEYSRWSLPTTAEDARALRAVLVDPARGAYPNDDAHIRLLSDADATRAAISAGLDWLATAVAADQDATAIVFYSGHGWTDGAGAYFLIPHDVDPLDIAGSALEGHAFTDQLRKIAARRLLVVLDCCHAGGVASAKGDAPVPKLPSGLLPAAAPKALVSELKQGTGRAVFSSSTGAQQSWVRPGDKLSLYTTSFIEALTGAASGPGDTTVRLLAIANYLSNAVTASAAAIGQEQTPFFDTATEDFPIALLLGGKGLNTTPTSPSISQAATPMTIRGDYVAGDKIGGDKIGGDKIVTNNYAPNQGAQGTFHGPVTFNVGGGSPPNQPTESPASPAEVRAAQIDALRNQLGGARKNLYQLLMQVAQHGGTMWAPIGLSNNIDSARREISRTKTALRNLGERADDLPDDEEI